MRNDMLRTPTRVSQINMNSKVSKENLQVQQEKILEFCWLQKKAGLEDITIKNRKINLIHLAKLGADLSNPDSVDIILATEPFTVAAKFSYVKAYLAFTVAFQIPWSPPKVKYQRPMPFIPLQAEIDQLIEECTTFGGTFVQIAQDTGARAGEVTRIKWMDINTRNKTISINAPEKGSNPRTVKVKDKTLSMIAALPKKHGDYLFNPNGITLRQGIDRAKKRLAKKTGNHRFLQMHLHTFRHFSATMEFARTKDILKTKQKLGHKSITSTEIYTHLVDFADTDYCVKRPKTADEEDELLKQGYEFVRFDERDHCPIYRKRM